jgi:NAD(P)-dependent dehydrogenase (short-subunit alcohol dehydrogenase family)
MFRSRVVGRLGGLRNHVMPRTMAGGLLAGGLLSGGLCSISMCSSTESSVRKVAVVTGAGSGIGKATSIAFAREGYSVVLAGRRIGPLEETAQEIQAECGPGTESLVVRADMCSKESVEALFASTKDAFGRVDVVFNNAGRGMGQILLEDVDVEEWRNIVDVNLTGVFLCTQEAFKIMKTQSPMGGRIINNGSISADRPRPNSAAYTATKHAVTGLTKATSLDGRKYNIACGQIDIGNAATPMTKKMKTGVPQANGEIKIEPTMDVEDVAKAVIYMSSLPLSANVLTMTVMATAMPLIGRG